jgi:hypothetical protein
MAGDHERTGVLVVRAWIEGDPPQLKARITQTTDVASREPVSSTASTAEHIFAAVRRWLEEFEARSTSVTGP